MIDGKNLLPLLSGKVEQVHDVVFGQQGPRLATVRDDRWKLHVLPAGDTRAGHDHRAAGSTRGRRTV